MKLYAVMVVLLSVGCGDDGKKSTTNPNNLTNNSTNNTTNNATTINISNYDQTCQNDSNCALVSTNPCGCSCPETGINTNDEAAFNTALAGITCSGPTPDCAACQQKLPACWEGLCQAREAQFVAAEDFDNSCETADDCIAIAIGELCDECQCASVAVNRADYQANRPAAPECTRAGTCDCASPGTLACNANICGFAE